MLQNYRLILRERAFRRFWLGFSFSEVGDAMTRVALTWFVYEETSSPEALGILMLCYVGPVIVGGLIAGALLDRFERRRVMLFDNVLRGAAMVSIPILYALNALELWHIYLVAAIYGLLYMISLAGGPSLIPSLVAREHLATANALETLAFTLAGVGGPVLAGLLIPRIGAPNVLVIDAISYLVFAMALGSIHPPRDEPAHPTLEAFHLGHALDFLRSNRTLFATTLMYMFANFGGGGILAVALPVLTAQTLGGGAELYGILLGARALGEVTAAFVAGGRNFSLSLGILICLALVFAGLSLIPLIFAASPVVVAIALFGFGVFDAPLTIWAQTLRMQVIPEHLRGRIFALIRMFIQSTGPAGSVAAGLLLPFLGLPIMLSLAAAFVGLPGLLGLQVRELRQADRAVVFDERV